VALSASRARAVATGLLVLLTAVWGSTFFLIRDLVATVPPTDFLAVRFSIAAVLMLVIFWPRVRRLGRYEWVVGLGLGVVYGVAQLLQTVGLAHTDASVSGFITGTYVVLTPVFSALLLRERVPPSTWLAVALATVGLGVLSLHGGLSLGLGETLTLACAAVYALHIIGLGRWSTPSHATGLAAVQMVAIAVVCVGSALPGGIVLPADGGQWAAVLYMATAAGVLALWVQTWAQARMSATRAAIVMTLEPVFAAFFAVVAGQEPLTWRMLVGGVLVLAAMYVVELRAAARRRAGEPSSEALHHEVT
jgi:drug/metabolite transporter (DMT)-like permease